MRTLPVYVSCDAKLSLFEQLALPSGSPFKNPLSEPVNTLDDVTVVAVHDQVTPYSDAQSVHQIELGLEQPPCETMDFVHNTQTQTTRLFMKHGHYVEIQSSVHSFHDVVSKYILV